MGDNFAENQLTMTLTYWAPGTPDGYGGGGWGAPTAIKGRWADIQELFIDAKGRQAQSNATAHADRDLALGGYLYNGTSAGANPTLVAGAREIRRFDKLPNFNATLFLRKAWM